MKNLYLLIITLTTLLNVSAQNHEWQWARTAVEPDITSTDAVVRGVATDRLGNVFATGFFYSDSLSFGPYTLYNSGVAGYTENIFTVKYDQSGNVLWARSAGGSRFDFPAGIRTDNTGNVYISGGFFSDSIFFDGYALYNYGPTDSTCDGFVAKYDPYGNFLWARSFGGDYYDGSDAMTTDPQGNVYVAGYFQSDSITIGTTKLYNSTGGVHDHNALLIKYDSLGNVLWAQSSNDINGGVEAYTVSTDLSGNVFLAGRFNGTSVTFGAQTIQNQLDGWNDIFVTKYDTGGAALWSEDAGGSLDDYAQGVAADAQGNIYITGLYNSPSVYFSGQTISNDTTDGTSDIFVAKYDTAGNLLWVNNAGGDQNDVGCGITCDTGSNIYVTGYFVSPLLIFGADTLVNFDNTGSTDDVFVVAFDRNGNTKTAVEAGGLSYDGGYAIAADQSANVYVGGFFRSDDIAFGTGILDNSTHTHDPNPFVAKYAAINTTGINAVKVSPTISLYPNPANNLIVAESPSFSSSGQVSATVYDETGNVMPVGQLFLDDKITFNTGMLAAGMYLIKFAVNGTETNAKFVKVSSGQ